MSDKSERIYSFGSGRTQTALELALKKGGFKMSTPAPKKWPRVRGPKAVRIDCATGQAVSFV